MQPRAIAVIGIGLLLALAATVGPAPVEEVAAYLAALPKAPNNYHPFRQRDRAVERRNYVLDRMAEDHYITAQDAEKSKKEPLKVTPRPTGAHIFAAEYFAEEVRRYVNENYTEKKLYEGGLSVRTTLDPKMQVLARKVREVLDAQPAMMATGRA